MWCVSGEFGEREIKMKGMLRTDDSDRRWKCDGDSIRKEEKLSGVGCLR